MLKTLKISVPAYLKNFYENDVEYYVNETGIMVVHRWSELGNLIHLACRAIPYQVSYPEQTGKMLMIGYRTREKSYWVEPSKLNDLRRQLDEIFRRTLIAEVRVMHLEHGGDYTAHIRSFCKRHNIYPDEDASWEQLRKIYRDFLSKAEKKNAKKYAEKVRI